MASVSANVTATCPECRAAADPAALQGLLEPRAFAQLLLASLRATHRLQTCPEPSCGASVYLEEIVAEQLTSKRLQRGREEPGLGSTVRCPACSNNFCLICGQHSHPRFTCEQARRGRARRQPESSDTADYESLEGLCVKPWPRCREGICKANEDDCDHMVCRNCKKEFCWQCFADREVISAHGNHFHERHCKFFAAFSGPPEYRPNSCPECKLLKRACATSRF
mmetsp:Transcript_76331/g.220571  ORF Transcript_76331/g.220571 Transcript_76331/m.220571 type:complete len:224 (+) Transcript_76331:196-867(+)